MVTKNIINYDPIYFFNIWIEVTEKNTYLLDIRYLRCCSKFFYKRYSNYISCSYILSLLCIDKLNDNPTDHCNDIQSQCIVKNIPNYSAINKSNQEFVNKMMRWFINNPIIYHKDIIKSMYGAWTCTIELDYQDQLLEINHLIQDNDSNFDDLIKEDIEKYSIILDYFQIYMIYDIIIMMRTHIKQINNSINIYYRERLDSYEWYTRYVNLINNTDKTLTHQQLIWLRISWSDKSHEIRQMFFIKHCEQLWNTIDIM